MSQTDCIGPMKVAMKLRRDMIAVACDSFMKMFQIGEEELIDQVSTAAAVLKLKRSLITVFFTFSLLENHSAKILPEIGHDFELPSYNYKPHKRSFVTN